jgi:hypothetical protein
VDDASFVAPQQKVKTAVVWDLQRTPWCWIGPEFAAECAAIASGSTPEFTPKARPAGGNELRQLRVKRGLSQRAVAKLVGCSQTKVSRSERGGSGRWPAIIRKALEG